MPNPHGFSPDRRAFLASLAAGAAAPYLAACSTDQIESTLAVTTTSTTTIPIPDPVAGQPWWLQGNFAPVGETDTTDVAVLGEVPEFLSGTYLRNGSNPASGASPHWFLGDGMLHGLRLDKGKPTWFRSRYVQTPPYLLRKGLLEVGIPGAEITNSNVSVFSYQDRILSLGEVGLPYEVSADLETKGAFTFDGRLAGSMTAHPKTDPRTGSLHFYGYNFAPPYLTYYRTDAEGAMVSAEPIELDAGFMIHDFAITETHAVFWVLPVAFDATQISSGLPYSWQPKLGSRLAVLPLDGGNHDVNWFELPECMVFHGVNAWEDGDELSLDVCRIDSAFDGRDLAGATGAELVRWTVDLSESASTNEVQQEQLSDSTQDFPMTDRRFLGSKHVHAWFTRIAHPEGGLDFSGLSHRNELTDTEVVWDAGGRFGPGEPFFVPRSDDSEEGDGVVMTYAFDRVRDASSLLIFEAQDIESGPVATLELPVRVPYGFHGWWV